MIRIPKELAGKIRVVHGEYVLDKSATEAEKLAFTRFLVAMDTTTDRVINYTE